MTRKERMKKARISLDNAMDVIDRVDNRCGAVDGPVTETADEIRPEEMKDIWRFLCLAKIDLTD